MALIVQKYGGTSVANIERIRSVARKVVERTRSGDQVVVVLSARAGDTDKLLQLAHDMSPDPDPRETDVLLATGEQITIALFSIAVKDMGAEAVSMTGYQAGIITDDHYGQARISWIETLPIMEKLHEGKIVVVAGFQGYDNAGNITTLGRGGSDTTAVPWRPRSALKCVKSIRMLKVFSPPTPIFTKKPENSPESATKKCWKWPVWAPRCCISARLNSA